MLLIKNGIVQPDPWVYITDIDQIDLYKDRPLIVTSNILLQNQLSLFARQSPLGLRLESNDRIADFAQYLTRLDLIVLVFPNFRDGRAYSQAVRLRQTYSFSGEIRAVGDVLRDQVHLMLRCGINAFEVADNFAIDIFSQQPFPYAYQASSDNNPIIADLRKISD